MPQSLPDNNGSTYFNRNISRSFNLSLNAGLCCLPAQVCAEIIIVNKTGQTVNVFDQGYNAAANAFQLANNDTFTFRGLTNANQLSAQTTSGAGTLYYRTQFFSFNALTS